jgi:hypothetical protein
MRPALVHPLSLAVTEGTAAKCRRGETSDARTGTYDPMFAVLLLLCLLMVVGAVLCAGAVLRMWSDVEKGAPSEPPSNS